MAGSGDGEIGQDAEEIAGVVNDGAVTRQELVELDAQRARVHGTRRVGDLEVASDVEAGDAREALCAVERLVAGRSLGQRGEQLLGDQAGIAHDRRIRRGPATNVRSW